MLPIPTSDINKIAVCLTVIGAFILAKNFLTVSADHLLLTEGLQLGGNSFHMKNQIVGKYNAWIGLSLVLLSAVIQLISMYLEKYITWADLGGRTVLFGSLFNSITTVALIIIILRIAIFSTDHLSKKEYYPLITEREKNNFEIAKKGLSNTQEKENYEKATKSIDRLLLLFDIKVKKETPYNDRVQKLIGYVFKKS